MYLVIFILPDFFVLDSTKGFSRYRGCRSILLSVVYIYMFGWLRRAICPVVSTSMLGVSHAVQNEKKLWKFTQSDEVRISARSTGGGCIRFHTAVIGGPSMTRVRGTCSVVSTSMLGVSHAVQNEKKLWNYTE